MHMHYILLNDKLDITTDKGPFLKSYTKKWYQNPTYLKCAGLFTDKWDVQKSKQFFFPYVYISTYQDRYKAELLIQSSLPYPDHQLNLL